jgi:hypothetical protein
VAFVELTYPHTPNLEAASFYKMTIPFNGSESKTRYDFVNFTSATPWAFTLDGQMKKIPVVETAGTFQVLIPNLAGGVSQDFILFDESQMISVTDLNPINGTGDFVNYSITNFESAYIIVSHKSLMGICNRIWCVSFKCIWRKSQCNSG